MLSSASMRDWSIVSTSAPLAPPDIIARFDHYRSSYRRDLFHRLRLALEQEVTANPDDPELTACLSHICSDAHRFGFARNETPFALKPGGRAGAPGDRSRSRFGARLPRDGPGTLVPA